MHPQDVLKYGHLTLMGTIERFPREHVYDRGACGYWSVKDLVAHLSSYELVLVELLGNLLEPCPTPLLDEFKGDGQAFNDRQVDVLRRDMTLEQAQAEYTSAYEQVAGLAARVPRSIWQQQGVLPWYGAEYDLEDFVVYTFYAHKREHCGQIQVFRDRFVETGPARTQTAG